jgi:hypothetical protein
VIDHRGCGASPERRDRLDVSVRRHHVRLFFDERF